MLPYLNRSDHAKADMREAIPCPTERSMVTKAWRALTSVAELPHTATGPAMPYSAAGRVVIVTPDEARAIAETGDIEVALSKDLGLDVLDIDGALFCALRALALKRAPQALGLFTRHWTISEQGRNYMVAGDHADLLGGDELASVLAAIDALLFECEAHPERIAAMLEAADLPHGMDAESAEADLREAASRAAPKTMTEANMGFKTAYPGDHLSAPALHAWLLAFAAWLRHARATGEFVVHIAMF